MEIAGVPQNLLQEFLSQQDLAASQEKLAECKGIFEALPRETEEIEALWQSDPSLAHQRCAAWEGAKPDDAFSVHEAQQMRGPDPLPEGLKTAERVKAMDSELRCASERQHVLVAQNVKTANLEEINDFAAFYEALRLPYEKELEECNKAVEQLDKPMLTEREMKRHPRIITALLTRPEDLADLRASCRDGVLEEEIYVGSTAIPEGSRLLKTRTVVRTTRGLQEMDILNGAVPEGIFAGHVVYLLPPGHATGDSFGSEQSQRKVHAVVARREALASCSLNCKEGARELVEKVNSSGTRVDSCAAAIDKGLASYQAAAAVPCEEAALATDDHAKLLATTDEGIERLEARQLQCEAIYDRKQAVVFTLENDAAAQYTALVETLLELARGKRSAEAWNSRNKEWKKLVSVAKEGRFQLSELVQSTKNKQEQMERLKKETVDLSEKSSMSLRKDGKQLALKHTETIEVMKLALQSSKEETDWLLEDLLKKVEGLKPVVAELEAELDEIDDPVKSEELRVKAAQLQSLEAETEKATHFQAVGSELLEKLSEEISLTGPFPDAEEKARKLYTPLKKREKRSSDSTAISLVPKRQTDQGYAESHELATLQLQMARMQRQVEEMQQKQKVQQERSFVIVPGRS